MKQTLEDVVTEALTTLDFELFELRRGGTKSRPVIEVRIDRRDGENVTLEDCARASRAIEARLDGSDLVAEQYVLQLSSPGVERPLRTPAEWRRFVGRRASVNSLALGGRMEGDLIAIEGEGHDEAAVLRDAKGVERRVALADVTDARLVFHWQR